jgi:predicted outer membrane lipoprotein
MLITPMYLEHLNVRCYMLITPMYLEHLNVRCYMLITPMYLEHILDNNRTLRCSKYIGMINM